MAEDRPVPAQQYRSHRPRLERFGAVPHGVHASVKDVQSPVLEAVTDRPPPEPERDQLPAGDDAVLALRESRDRPVDVKSGPDYGLKSHLAPRCHRGSHARATSVTFELPSGR